MENSIIIPAYSEEKRIKKVIMNYSNYFKNSEIIVVCNGCTDSTVEIVNEVMKTSPNIKLREFKEKLGKGGAVIKGLKVAVGDVVGFIDADDSTSPESYTSLLDMISKGHNGAIGSRKIYGAKISVKQPLRRRISSRIFKKVFYIKYSQTLCHYHSASVEKGKGKGSGIRNA